MITAKGKGEMHVYAVDMQACAKRDSAAIMTDTIVRHSTKESVIDAKAPMVSSQKSPQKPDKLRRNT